MTNKLSKEQIEQARIWLRQLHHLAMKSPSAPDGTQMYVVINKCIDIAEEETD
jgi:hypothetical protein